MNRKANFYRNHEFTLVRLQKKLVRHRSRIYLEEVKYRLPLMIAFSACAAFLLSSCNTFVGMGRDFKRVGQGFENAAYGKKF
jgi:predicted small secreted protein